MKKCLLFLLSLSILMGCSVPKNSDKDKETDGVEITDDYEIPEVEGEF